MMENMQKIITTQDVAKAAGCCVSTVHCALSNEERRRKMVSSKTRERVLAVAKELGYDVEKAKQYGSRAGGKIGVKIMQQKRYGGRPTMQNVADKCGCSVSTVRRAFVSPETVNSYLYDQIITAAAEIGFVYHANLSSEERTIANAAKAKIERERKFSLRYAGFKNRDEQNEYMEAMRSMGYSNAQISRKVGLHVLTVYRRIGPQPEDMSRDNRVAGMKHRAAENQRRRVYVDNHLVRTYNNLVMECGKIRQQAAELNAKADELTAEIVKMRPQVDQAKLATEKPAELPAEQLRLDVSAAPAAVLQ